MLPGTDALLAVLSPSISSLDVTHVKEMYQACPAFLYILQLHVSDEKLGVGLGTR